MAANMNALRRALYSLARLLGWLNAIARGRFLQRVMRASLYRRGGAFINKVIK